MVRLTDRLDMTIAVDWDVKLQNNHNIKGSILNSIMGRFFCLYTVKLSYFASYLFLQYSPGRNFLENKLP